MRKFVARRSGLRLDLEIHGSVGGCEHDPSTRVGQRPDTRMVVAQARPPLIVEVDPWDDVGVPGVAIHGEVNDYFFVRG